MGGIPSEGPALAALLRVFFVVAFGTQTDQILVDKGQVWKIFSRFFVVDMSRFDSSAIPLTFPAFESIAPKNLNPLSVLRMRPTRICVVKFHRQKNKKSPRAQRLLYSWALGLYWSDIQFKPPAAPGTHHRQCRNAGSSDRLKQEFLTSRTAHLVTRNDSRSRTGR